MTEGDRQIIPLLTAILATGGSSGASTGGAASSVAGKYRFKADGTFQLYNTTTSKYHTLSLSGADGAVTIDIAAGEA